MFHSSLCLIIILALMIQDYGVITFYYTDFKVMFILKIVHEILFLKISFYRFSEPQTYMQSQEDAMVTSSA
jgi:hypothetical protein